MTNNLIVIVAQGWYGNRTGTEVRKEKIDEFICNKKPANRTIVSIPNTENVIIYNKHNEDEWLKRKERLWNEENYKLKYTVYIPEKNIKIYSRCIVCRLDENGEPTSLQSGDYEKFVKYLAE